MHVAAATELDALRTWVDGVAQLPKLFRTREARALFDALEKAGLASVEALSDTLDLNAIARRIGQNAEILRASIKRCPFGFSL